jgi:hypothetical protein
MKYLSNIFVQIQSNPAIAAFTATTTTTITPPPTTTITPPTTTAITTTTTTTLALHQARVFIKC